MNLEDSVEASESTTNGDVEEPSGSTRTAGTYNTSLDPNAHHERPTCKFGTQCYRQNPRHRVDMAHPGDIDYELPPMPSPDENAPECEFGRKCYRLNPEHFKNFKHPRNINIQANYRKKFRRATNDSGSDEIGISDDDEEDPFDGDDDDSDFVPSE